MQISKNTKKNKNNMTGKKHKINTRARTLNPEKTLISWHENATY